LKLLCRHFRRSDGNKGESRVERVDCDSARRVKAEHEVALWVCMGKHGHRCISGVLVLAVLRNRITVGDCTCFTVLRVMDAGWRWHIGGAGRRDAMKCRLRIGSMLIERW
jgi:hypothetical protein